MQQQYASQSKYMHKTINIYFYLLLISFVCFYATYKQIPMQIV